MAGTAEDQAYYSDICVERCGGMCCDPWWGIISFTVTKPGGLASMAAFTDKLARGIEDRARRIIEGYVTRETTPRALFGRPDVYSVKVRSIRAEGTTIVAELLAMFAFRCRFLSDENVCTVHPSVIGGDDIRPPHCGYMGTPGAVPGEKGYCRILAAAGSAGDGADEAVADAIGVERGASEKHRSEGHATASEAASAVVAEVRAWCEASMPDPGPARAAGAGGAKVGRNDPCPCGSNKKYKKCHGR
jgi:hypothetical protein